MRKINVYLHIKAIVESMIYSLSKVNPIAIGFCFILPLVLTSCMDASLTLYHGSEDDFFMDTDVKQVNLPILVELVGMIFHTICTTLLLNSYTGKAKIKLKYYILANVLISTSVFSLTSFLGLLAIGMEVLDIDTTFHVLLILQIAFLLLSCLSALELLGSNLSAMGIRYKWFYTIGLFSNRVSKKITNTDSENHGSE